MKKALKILLAILARIPDPIESNPYYEELAQ